MCEQCEARRARNTQIKRAVTDALFGAGGRGDQAEGASEIPGFLALCRGLERISRAPLVNGEIDPEEAALVRRAILALSPDGRTDVLRIAEYVTDMATGVRMNVAQAKLNLKDMDTATIAVALQDGAVVLYVNGDEVHRIELAPDADPDAALDAAERAMRAHRAQHGHDEGRGW